MHFDCPLSQVAPQIDSSHLDNRRSQGHWKILFATLLSFQGQSCKSMISGFHYRYIQLSFQCIIWGNTILMIHRPCYPERKLIADSHGTHANVVQTSFLKEQHNSTEQQPLDSTNLGNLLFCVIVWSSSSRTSHVPRETFPLACFHYGERLKCDSYFVV